MLKRQNFKVSLAFAIGFILFSFEANADFQQQLDKMYTTKTVDKTVFTKQILGLNDDDQDKLILGKSFFRIPWVEAPSATTARDGLGPLFNANTCVSCHPNNGRGSIYNKNHTISRAYVTRLSIPSNGSKKHKNMQKYSGCIKEEVYGEQVSINGVYGVPFEAKPLILYKKNVITYPDGSKVTLKQPVDGTQNRLKDLQYGKLQRDVIITNRLAPALIGLGLLEQLTDEQILKNQDIKDENNDGISGKANIVYSPLNKDFRVGRYTYKASAPSLLHQTAGAAYNDMSLTNPLFPLENCTKNQKECLDAPKGDNLRGDTPFDLPMRRIEAITFYLKNLKIPRSTITQKKGEKFFSSIGCIKCHIASYTLSNGYLIKPFTDMLLHDMGEDLSDGRKEFKATPREWRTPALWGIGKYRLASRQAPELLHDGRAKTIEEAILWHGGEARKIKINFMNLSYENREKIINYIKEL